MTIAFEPAWERAEGIDGWLTDAQARILHGFASVTKVPGWIVEIGSHHGRSTVMLATGAPEGVSVLAVDPFEDPRWGGGSAAIEAFIANIASAELQGRVRTFRGTSAQAAHQWPGDPLQLLFVDGAHDLRSVLVDIDSWEPFLVSDGVVCFHDAFSSVGVTGALLRRHLWNRSFRYLGAAGSLVAYRREDLASAATVGSAMRQIRRMAWFGRNLAVKVAMRRGWSSLTRVLGHEGETYPY
jgi:predicted O-methyltransferase YrrM